MPNIQDAFPSKYVKASDFHGAQPVVTIDRVEYEPVGRDRQMKPIVYFAGKEKGLVLNKTNANKITQLLGSGVTEDWNGCRITLYATEVQFGDETMEGIRIKAAPKQASPQRQTAPPPKPNPAGEFDANEAYAHAAGDDDSDIPF